MSSTLLLQFAFAELKLCTGKIVTLPFSCLESLRVEENAQQISEHFARALQKSLLEKGEYLEVLKLATVANIQKAQITLDIATAKQKKLAQHYDLYFDYFYWDLPQNQNKHSGYLALIPALGIEVYSYLQENLEEKIEQAIRLEFIRKKRLKNLHRIIEVQWFDDARAHTFPTEMEFYTPLELEQLHQHKKHHVIKDVASKILLAQSCVSHMESSLLHLQQVMEGQFIRSVLLLGPNACGKTALLKHYLWQRQKQNLAGTWETTASRLVQGLSKGSGWQKNLSLMVSELRENEEWLYVDHILELFEVGQYAGNSVSIGEALRESVQRGDIILIAEATEEELSVMELKSPGFAALFQILRLEIRDETTQWDIIHNAVELLAERKQVNLEIQAIAEIIRLHRRFSPYSGFPGKTIRFLETLILQKKHQQGNYQQLLVSKKDVITAFSEESGIPGFMVDPGQDFDRKKSREFFRQRIFGQNQASDVVLNVLISVKAAMTRSGKPIASLLFIGPTGVGKTEMAKTLAEFMFSDRRKLIRLDMSEYADPASVLRLTGEWGAQGQSLVTQIRQQPFSVVLLDELEKAHYSFFDLLLQILGEGRLTDAQGQVANFCSAIIIMTSNLGAQRLQKNAMGFHSEKEDTQAHAQYYAQTVQEFFRPELFNRLDQIVAFSLLNSEQRKPILQRELETLKQRVGLRDRNVQLIVDDTALHLLSKKGHDVRYGARQMQRVLQQQVVIPLAKKLNQYPHALSLQIRLTTAMPANPDTASDTLVMKVQQQDEALSHKENFTIFLHKVTTLRRQIDKIAEASAYISLLNSFDRLTAKKQKQGDKFWEQKQQAESWQKLSMHIEKYQDLYQIFMDLEVEANLVLTGNKQEVGLDVSLFERSLRDFQECKQQLYHNVYPGSEYAVIGIYGAAPLLEKLVKYYGKLLDVGDYNYQLLMVRVSNDKYLHDSMPLDAKAQAKPGTCIGYALEVKGLCIALLLQLEQGVLRWIMEDNSKKDFYIHLQEGQQKNYKTPEQVHRRHFYNGLTPDRKIKADQLMNAAKHQEWVIDFPRPELHMDYLQQQLTKKLDIVLMGEEEELSG